MAGNDSQKQLLTLIRGFASEKSQGERRVSNLRKQIGDLRSTLEAENSELEEAKRTKEVTEQELKGYELELAMNEASIQALESRTSAAQDEISAVGYDVEALKSEEANTRDEFINEMFEMNARIRNFYKQIETKSNSENSQQDDINGEDARRDLETKLTRIISQINTEEQEIETGQRVNKQLQQELVDLERKVSLMGEVVKASRDLQELTNRTPELEEMCTFLGEELQKKCVCPNCHMQNVQALSGVLQRDKGT